MRSQCPGGQPAIGLRADVQEEVAALGDDLHKELDQPVCRLVLVVGLNDQESPIVMHFPRRGQRLVRHFLLRREIVLVTAAHRAVGNDQPRLVPAGHGRQPVHIDVLLGRPDLAGVEKQRARPGRNRLISSSIWP